MIWIKCFFPNVLRKISGDNVKTTFKISRRFFDEQRKFCRCFVQIFFMVPQKVFDDRYFKLSFVLYIFSNFQLKCLNIPQNVSTLPTKLVHRCWHCFLTLFRKFLVTIYFKKGLIFYLFSDFHQNFFWIFGRVAKIAFSVARWKLHATKIFL